MKISRREFLLLTAGLAGGCATGEDGGAAPARSVNAGPAANYARDGVYAKFRDQGFFVIRSGGKLFALSAICTHRRCRLTAQPDGSFYCPCHGSLFDAAGHVTQGPAQRDLPVLAASSDEQGELVVGVPAR